MNTPHPPIPPATPRDLPFSLALAAQASHSTSDPEVVVYSRRGAPS